MSSGISFIVRVRNEEKTLEESILSLFNLTIPHEINIILHCCTDNSENIARKLSKQNNNINIFIYDKKLSRAGYETLATDSTSAHSIVKYTNYCFSTGKYSWKFKWDADFTASHELIHFLNSKDWVQEDAYYVINYKMKTLTSGEMYLLSSNIYFKKYIWWENTCRNNYTVRYVLDSHICIHHHQNNFDA